MGETERGMTSNKGPNQGHCGYVAFGYHGASAHC